MKLFMWFCPRCGMVRVNSDVKAQMYCTHGTGTPQPAPMRRLHVSPPSPLGEDCGCTSGPAEVLIDRTAIAVEPDADADADTQ